MRRPAFRVFISSTFADFRAERAALRSKVFEPLARELASDGFDFDAIDLRWGISAETARNHETIPVCLDELRRCRERSPFVFMVALIGERYGWVPRPATLGQDAHAALREQMGSAGGLFDDAYRHDLNARPPVWIARPLDSADEARVEQAIAAAAGLAFAHDRRRADAYVASATHLELNAGLFDAPADTRAGAVVCVRTIDGLPRDTRALPFVDGTPDTGLDAAARARVERLRTRLRSTDGVEPIEYTAQWAAEGLSASLDALCEAVERAIRGRVREAIARWQAIPRRERERRRHSLLRAGHTRSFRGRRDELETVRSHFEAGGIDRPLLVSGPGGSGKSALLAHAPELARGAGFTPICYSVGSTTATSSLEGLLGALLTELSGATDVTAGPSSSEAEATSDRVARLMTRAAAALAEQDTPIALILDGLDAIEDDLLRYRLRWVPLPLPDSVRLIVGLRPGPTARVFAEAFPTLHRLSLGPLGREDARAIVLARLAAQGRTLQAAQLDRLLSHAAVIGNPLLVTMAAREAARWPSWHPGRAAGPDLPAQIAALIEGLCDPARHAARLVHITLAALAVARFGLSEHESKALLGRDPSVLAHVRRLYPWVDPGGRLPPVLWARLRQDLDPYLTEREGHGAQVLAFEHAAMHAAAAAHLAAESARVHAALAGLFEWRGSAPGISHRRVLVELPHHLAAGRTPDALVALLTDLAFVQDKVAAGLARDLLADYARAPDDAGAALVEMWQFVRRSVDRFDRSPQRVLDLALNAAHGPTVVAAARRCLGDAPRLDWLNRDERSTGGTWSLPEDWRYGIGWTAAGHLVTHRGRAVVEWWDPASGAPLGARTMHDLPDEPEDLGREDFILSANGERLALGWEGRVGVWSCASGRRIFSERLYDAPVHVITSRARPAGDDHPASVVLATADRRGLIRICNHAEAGEGGYWPYHDDRVCEVDASVTCVALSSDGAWLVAGDRHGVVVGLRVPYGTALGLDEIDAIWQAPTPIHACDMGRVEGADLVAVGGEGAVWVIGWPDGRAIASATAHEGPVGACSMVPDAARLLTGGADGRVTHWAFDAREAPRTIGRLSSAIVFVSWVSEGPFIAAGARSGEIAAWRPDGERVLTYDAGRTLTGGHAMARGRQIALAGPDGVEVIDWLSSPPRVVWQAPIASAACHVLAGDDTVVVGRHDGRVCARALADGDPVGSALEARHTPGVFIESLSPDGTRMVVKSPSCIGLELWDIDRAVRLADLRGFEQFHFGPVGFSPDGDVLYMVHADGLVTWDARSGDWLGHRRFAVEHDPFYYHQRALAVRPDGGRIAFGRGQRGEHEAEVIELPSGRPVGGLGLREPDGQSVYAVAFAPDGERIATASTDGAVRLWDADGRECARVVEPGAAEEVRFSPDGRWLAGRWSRGAVVVWPAAPARHRLALSSSLGTWDLQETITARLSPSGRWLAVADAVSVHVTAFPEHIVAWSASRQASSLSLTWSPDERLLAFAEEDRVAVVSTKTWHRVHVSARFDGCVERLAFGADGATLWVSDDDGGLFALDMTADLRPRPVLLAPRLDTRPDPRPLEPRPELTEPAFVVSPCGRWLVLRICESLAFPDSTGQPVVLDLDTGAVSTLPFRCSPDQIHFAPDDTIVGTDGAHVYGCRPGDREAARRPLPEAGVSALAPCDDRRFVLAAWGGRREYGVDEIPGALRIIDRTSGDSVARLPQVRGSLGGVDVCGAHAVAWTTRGELMRLAIGGLPRGTLAAVSHRLYDAVRGRWSDAPMMRCPSCRALATVESEGVQPCPACDRDLDVRVRDVYRIGEQAAHLSRCHREFQALLERHPLDDYAPFFEWLDPRPRFAWSHAGRIAAYARRLGRALTLTNRRAEAAACFDVAVSHAWRALRSVRRHRDVAGDDWDSAWDNEWDHESIRDRLLLSLDARSRHVDAHASNDRQAMYALFPVDDSSLGRGPWHVAVRAAVSLADRAMAAGRVAEAASLYRRAASRAAPGPVFLRVKLQWLRALKVLDAKPAEWDAGKEYLGRFAREIGSPGDTIWMEDAPDMRGDLEVTSLLVALVVLLRVAGHERDAAEISEHLEEHCRAVGKVAPLLDVAFAEVVCAVCGGDPCHYPFGERWVCRGCVRDIRRASNLGWRLAVSGCLLCRDRSDTGVLIDRGRVCSTCAGRLGHRLWAYARDEASATTDPGRGGPMCDACGATALEADFLIEHGAHHTCRRCAHALHQPATLLPSGMLPTALTTSAPCGTCGRSADDAGGVIAICGPPICGACAGICGMIALRTTDEFARGPATFDGWRRMLEKLHDSERRADLARARGDLEAARRIMREEHLPVYDERPFATGRAAALARMADLDVGAGHPDAAMALVDQLVSRLEDGGGDHDAATLGPVRRLAESLASEGWSDQADRVWRAAFDGYTGHTREILLAFWLKDLGATARWHEQSRVLREVARAHYAARGELTTWAAKLAEVADALDAAGHAEDALVARLTCVTHAPAEIEAMWVVIAVKIIYPLLARGALDELERLLDDRLWAEGGPRLALARCTALDELTRALLDAEAYDAALRVLTSSMLPALAELADDPRAPTGHEAAWVARVTAAAHLRTSRALRALGRPVEAYALMTDAGRLAAAAVGGSKRWGVEMHSVAEALRATERPEVACDAWRAVLPVFAGPDDHEPRSVVLRRLASTLLERGRVREARDCLCSEAPSTFEASGGLHLFVELLGRVADRLDGDDALDVRRRHLVPAARLLSDPDVEATRVRRFVFDLCSRDTIAAADEAEALLRATRSAFERSGRVRDWALGMDRVAGVLGRSAQPERALRIRLTDERPVYRAVGDTASASATTRQIAELMRELGQLDDAFEVLEAGRGEGAAADALGAWGVAMHRLASVARSADRPDLAVAAWRAAHTAFDGPDGAGSRAIVARELAATLRDAGDLHGARAVLDDACRADHLACDQTRALITELMALCDAYESRGAVSDALDAMRTALVPALDSVGIHPTAGLVRCHMALFCLDGLALADARRHLVDAHPVCAETGNRAQWVSAALLVLAGHDAEGDARAAESLGQLVHTTVEAGLGDDELHVRALLAVAQLRFRAGDAASAASLARDSVLPSMRAMGHPAVGAALLELAQFLRADHQLERSLDLLLDEALPALQSADQTLNRLMAWFEVAELHGLAGHSSAALDAWRTGALPTAIELDDPFWLHAVWDETSTCLSAAGDIGGALDAQCDGALSAARRLDPAGRVTAALPAIRLWLRAAETEAPDAIEQHRRTLIAYVSAALESASAADVDADAVEYLTEWLREARGDALDVDDA